MPDSPLHDHLIVCGMGHVGFRIVELLNTLGEPYAVIAKQIRPAWRPEIERRAARLVDGDARADSSLIEAGIRTAKALIVVTNDDLVNVEVAMDAQRLNPELPIIVRVFDRYLADRIDREMNVRRALSPALLTAPVFVAAALGDEMVRAFHIDGHVIDVVKVSFTEGNAAEAASVGALCAHYDGVAIAFHHSAAPRLNDCAAIHPGDELVAATSGSSTFRLRKFGFLPGYVKPPSAIAQRLRRLYAFLHRTTISPRDILRFWRNRPVILRAAAIALVLLVLTTAVVFHEALPSHPSWIDSFYFVTTILTTVGFGDFNLRSAPWWVKIYGCLVMMGGATLVAILFGLITDYIVALRVDQALGRRHSHSSDHVVVIGLGDVGTRVTEEIHRAGISVVAIDRDANHESLSMLQDRLHVIVGDANRESTLEHANIMQARAVIVTTTNDLDSLRIAHRAELINPHVRSVIRIYDSSLAEKLGGGLGMDQTVNAAAVAAATFVACALETDVEEAFVVDDRLLMLRWSHIGAHGEDPRAGQTMAALREAGTPALLRRTSAGDHAKQEVVAASAPLQHGEDVLLLEEYYPERHATGPPRLIT